MKTILIFFPTLVLLPIFAFGQQQQKSTQRPTNGYAIQTTFEDGHSNFTPMYGEKFSGGTGFTLSPWTVIRRAAKDSEQVSLVNIAAELEGSEWKLTVSVTFGQFYDQGSRVIASYHTPLGEKVKIKEMSNYGVQPFDVSIVKVLSAPPIQPEVLNRTNSIAVLNVLATSLPEPFRVELKNNSEKAVRALQIDTLKGKKTLYIQWPQGTSWDHPLIEPGSTYMLTVSSAGRDSTVDSEYVPDQTTIIEISTAVFADGTFEGKPYLAVTKRSEDVGSKHQLERVLHLIKVALESSEQAPKQTLLNLRHDTASLGEEVDAVWLKELLRNFPILNENEQNNLPNFVKYGLHQVKKEFLKELGDYEQTEKRADRVTARDWLSKVEVKYRKWHESLP